MKHKPFILLDIETTGGSTKYGRVTEIGALRIENEKVVSTFKQLVNPEQKIPYYITKLTGIDNDMAWKAPTFKRIANELESFMSDSVFIAHNVNFDYGFIKMEFERLGCVFNMDRACSARLSKKLHPEFKSHALDRIIERLDLTIENRHRAFDDAKVIWKFLEHELNIDNLRVFRSLNDLIVHSK